MAEATQWTVYVPDRTEPIRVPRSLTADEVRQTLASTGFSALSTADMTQSGDTLTFRRPTGGTKGR